MSTAVSIHFPTATNLAVTADAPSGGSATGYSVNSIGTGSFTGLSYTVPAFSTATVNINIQTMAMTSEDVANLNNLVNGMLNASQQQTINSSSTSSSSSNLSIWSFFSGGNDASSTQTTNAMSSLGLSQDQITTIINQFAALAGKMNTVSMQLTVDNSNNDYSVSGDVELYTIGGTVTTDKGTVQYRMLADSGSAGTPGQTAPATSKIVPLN